MGMTDSSFTAEHALAVGAQPPAPAAWSLGPGLSSTGPPASRWGIAMRSVVIQVVLGSTLAWSVYRDPLVAAFGWTISQVTLAFAINLFVSGIASGLGGIWIARAGPRVVGLAAGLFFGLGLGLASLAADRLWLLYLGYGLVGGIGRGLGVIVPPATVVPWFPERRGALSGLVGAGFGVGVLLAAPAAAALIPALGVLPTMAVVGAVGAAVIIWMALALELPSASRPVAGVVAVPPSGPDATLAEALRTPAFYGLWALLFLSTFGGLAFMSQAVPMAREVARIEPDAALGAVGLAALALAFGQFFWAWLSDRVGRRAVFLAMLLIQAGAFLLMPLATTLVGFAVLAIVVMLCYGGAPGTMPAFAADYFGARSVGAVWGCLVTAMGSAAVLGPMVIAAVRDETGSYGLALAVIGGLAAVGTALPLTLRPPSESPLSSRRLPAAVTR
jgi:OFA family oxalate/formate antiporter-like MFS transporter